MPLPQADLAWPPAELGEVTDQLAEWSAWYSGDADELTARYGGAPGYSIGPRTKRRGVGRWFWGQQPAVGQPRAKLHVPIAADIASGSADLLFAEEVRLNTPDATSVQRERLDEVLDRNRWSAWLPEGADVASGLGGVYWRVTWDATVADEALLTWVHADAAVPEFRYGRLTAVTFWREVDRTGQVVLRHLERHERGAVLHGLYEGSPTKLGRVVPLTDHPSTEDLRVNAEAAIPTQYDDLTAGYVPNMLPNRGWRNDPVGCHLGRSDFDGVEPFMDALDEAYTSWLRDIRLGKARIDVPDYMLENLGAGMGARFDLDQELFSGLNIPPSDAERGIGLTVTQFAIRHEEHAATCNAWTQTIVRSAGYSPATFGMSDDVAATATEVNARERRSLTTREKKTRYWDPELRKIIRALTAVDTAQFAGTGVVDADVEFTAGAQPTALELAQTGLALRSAQAVLTLTLVKLQHPDWDETAVLEESARIMRENNLGDVGPLPGDPEQPAEDDDSIRERADALGVLIRAGVDPVDAAQRVGLAGIRYTGAIPTSLRLPEADAAGLEGGGP